MSGHTIAWTIDSDSIMARVTCHEPRGAECHRGVDAYLNEVSIYPHCNPVTWIEEGDGWGWTYDGPEEPLRDGPITFAWDGDDWSWSYVKADQ